MRVLVVDDNQHMVNIVKTILRGFGIKEFFDAHDPSDALDVLRSTQVDLIITDYAMEPMDGCEFVRFLRRSDESPNKFIPVIMLTAYSERSRVESARDAGVNEFCTKPVTAMELYKKVRSIINAPRTFIRTGVYFGPDRRRHTADGFDGDERRDKDRDETVKQPADREHQPA